MADYQTELSNFDARGVKVIVVSSDPRAEAEKIQTELGLTIPIGYELDPEHMSQLTGAFYDAEDEEPYLHATGFLINNESKVETAVYSTGSVGRLTAEDALRQTNHLTKNQT